LWKRSPGETIVASSSTLNGNSLAWWVDQLLLVEHSLSSSYSLTSHETQSRITHNVLLDHSQAACPVTKLCATQDLWGGHVWRIEGNVGCTPSWNGITTSRVGRRNTAI
jgi:hypothetical protein